MIETALVDLIDQVADECVQHQRPDLFNRLRQIRNRILDPSLLVLVVGEFKQGKSSLINAVVNAPVCGVGDDVETLVPSIIRHSDEPTALLVEESAPMRGPSTVDRLPVPIERVNQEVTQAVTDGRSLTRSEIGLPRTVLKDGLVLMDTPGVGSISSLPTTITHAAAAESDALLMVSDATQELTATELHFLKQMTALCPNLALVQTKIDATPYWRQIIEANVKHLYNAGIPAKVFPVSSTVRARATQSQDAELDAESGFTSLLEYLRTELVGRHEDLSRRLVAHNVSDVLDQLITSLRTELASQSPRTAAEILLELESAQHRAEELRRISSRWQRTLADGITEMMADIEYDFRERTFTILHHVNDTFDHADPNDVWDDFRAWLDDSLSESILATFQWINDRSEELLDRVSEEVYLAKQQAAPQLDFVAPSDILEQVPSPKQPTNANFRPADRFLSGLRGSYAGVLMFGLITSNALGFPLMSPISIGAGILLGSKSMKEETDSRLKRRQAEAKAAAQRYVEHVIFEVNKETKDAIRHTQRMLHNHFTDVVEETQTQISQTIQDAKRSAERNAVEREDRAREIRKKLEQLAVLKQRTTLFNTNRITAA